MIAPHNINNPGWQGPGGTQQGWQPPRDLPGLTDLVNAHGHRPIWVHPDLHNDLLAHYGGNGMVVAHPSAGGGASGAKLPTEPSAPTPGLFPGDVPQASPQSFQPFVPPLDTGFGPQSGVTPGSPLQPDLSTLSPYKPYDRPGGSYNYFAGLPSWTAPSGSTFYQTNPGQFVNSAGIPRAIAVNPNDDPYGLSGNVGPVAGPQANPADFAMKGLAPVVKYL